jgi:hypothetical protein
MAITTAAFTDNFGLCYTVHWQRHCHESTKAHLHFFGQRLASFGYDLLFWTTSMFLGTTCIFGIKGLIFWTRLAWPVTSVIFDQVRAALHRARYETAPQAVVSKRGRVEAGPTAAPALTMLATLAFGHHEDRMPMHGYEPTREAAMAAFGKTWRRNDPH